MMMTNPFLDLPFGSLSFMQGFVVVMAVLVVAGTLFDIVHKQSARYFFANMRRAKSRARRPVGGGEKAAIAVKTLASEVLTSSEFCNPSRRLAHLLTMYGFIAFVVATAVLVFVQKVPPFWSLMWHIGALSVCYGGGWFWFFIRADVAAEGGSPLRFVKADLFVVSLVATTLFGLLWSFTRGSAADGFFHLLFLGAAAALFGGVPWSKFAHMFFKPAAAFEKRLSEADGSRDGLPEPADAPAKFGLGIKRELPRHY